MGALVHGPGLGQHPHDAPCLSVPNLPAPFVPPPTHPRAEAAVHRPHQQHMGVCAAGARPRRGAAAHELVALKPKAHAGNSKARGNRWQCGYGAGERVRAWAVRSATHATVHAAALCAKVQRCSPTASVQRRLYSPPAPPLLVPLVTVSTSTTKPRHQRPPATHGSAMRATWRRVAMSYSCTALRAAPTAPPPPPGPPIVKLVSCIATRKPPPPPPPPLPPSFAPNPTPAAPAGNPAASPALKPVVDPAVASPAAARPQQLCTASNAVASTSPEAVPMT